MSRLHYFAALVWIGLSVFMIRIGPLVPAEAPPVEPPATAAAWFRRVRPMCNALEADLALSRNPPPPGYEGVGYAAACLALAGRINEARSRILDLDADLRWRAAGVVFEVGHPVADAGDDPSAGPIMALVVEFWPNHHMALYHAGVAALQGGRRGLGRSYLWRFLQEYQVDDGWSRNALRLAGRPPSYRP